MSVFRSISGFFSSISAEALGLTDNPAFEEHRPQRISRARAAQAVPAPRSASVEPRTRDYFESETPIRFEAPQQKSSIVTEAVIHHYPSGTPRDNFSEEIIKNSPENRPFPSQLQSSSSAPPVDKIISSEKQISDKESFEKISRRSSSGSETSTSSSVHSPSSEDCDPVFRNADDDTPLVLPPLGDEPGDRILVPQTGSDTQTKASQFQQKDFLNYNEVGQNIYNDNRDDENQGHNFEDGALKQHGYFKNERDFGESLMLDNQNWSKDVEKTSRHSSDKDHSDMITDFSDNKRNDFRHFNDNDKKCDMNYLPDDEEDVSKYFTDSVQNMNYEKELIKETHPDLGIEGQCDAQFIDEPQGHAPGDLAVVESEAEAAERLEREREERAWNETIRAISQTTRSAVGSRRTSSASMFEPPPEVDLSYLNEEERAAIEAVMERARMIQEEDFMMTPDTRSLPSVSTCEGEMTSLITMATEPEQLSLDSGCGAVCSLCGSGARGISGSFSLDACVNCMRLFCSHCGNVQDDSFWCNKCQPLISEAATSVTPTGNEAINFNDVIFNSLSGEVDRSMPKPKEGREEKMEGFRLPTGSYDEVFQGDEDLDECDTSTASTARNSIVTAPATNPDSKKSAEDTKVETSSEYYPIQNEPSIDYADEFIRDDAEVTEDKVKDDEVDPRMRLQLSPRNLEQSEDGEVDVWKMLDDASPSLQKGFLSRPRNLTLSRQEASISADSPTEVPGSCTSTASTGSAGSTDSSEYDIVERSVSGRVRDSSQADSGQESASSTMTMIGEFRRYRRNSNEHADKKFPSSKDGAHSSFHWESSSSTSSSESKNQSPSRRSPKSPPRSPNWMRLRESPTRSPPVVAVRTTRSPQMSPCNEVYPPSKIEDTMTNVPGMPCSENDLDDESRRTPPSLHYDISADAIGWLMATASSASNEASGDMTSNTAGGAQINAAFGESKNITGEDYLMDLASYAASVASGAAHLASMSVSPPQSMNEIQKSEAQKNLPSGGLDENISEQTGSYFLSGADVEGFIDDQESYSSKSYEKDVQQEPTNKSYKREVVDQDLNLNPPLADWSAMGLSALTDSTSPPDEMSNSSHSSSQRSAIKSEQTQRGFYDIEETFSPLAEDMKAFDYDYVPPESMENLSKSLRASSLETSPTSTTSTFKRCRSYSNIQSAAALAEVLENKAAAAAALSSPPKSEVTKQDSGEEEHRLSVTDCFDLSAFQEFKSLDIDESNRPTQEKEQATDSFTDDWFSTVVSRKSESTNPFTTSAEDELPGAAGDAASDMKNPFEDLQDLSEISATRSSASEFTNPFMNFEDDHLEKEKYEKLNSSYVTFTNSSEDKLKDRAQISEEYDSKFLDTASQRDSNLQSAIGNLSPSFLFVAEARQEHNFLSDEEPNDDDDDVDDDDDEEDREIDLDEDIPPKHLFIQKSKKSHNRSQDKQDGDSDNGSDVMSVQSLPAADMNKADRGIFNRSSSADVTTKPSKGSRRRLPPIPRERDTDDVLSSLLLSPDDSPVRMPLKHRSSSSDAQLPPPLPTRPPPPDRSRLNRPYVGKSSEDHLSSTSQRSYDHYIGGGFDLSRGTERIDECDELEYSGSPQHAELDVKDKSAKLRSKSAEEPRNDDVQTKVDLQMQTRSMSADDKPVVNAIPGVAMNLINIAENRRMSQDKYDSQLESENNIQDDRSKFESHAEINVNRGSVVTAKEEWNQQVAYSKIVPHTSEKISKIFDEQKINTASDVNEVLSMARHEKPPMTKLLDDDVSVKTRIEAFENQPKEETKVPSKPTRVVQKKRESTISVYGVIIPASVHSIHQRVKDEVKIVTATKRLKYDEEVQIRMMEAELSARERERRSKTPVLSDSSQDESWSARARLKRIPLSQNPYRRDDATVSDSEFEKESSTNYYSTSTRASYSGTTRRSKRYQLQEQLLQQQRLQQQDRQISDPMVSKCSPIEEDRGIVRSIQSSPYKHATLPRKGQPRRLSSSDIPDEYETDHLVSKRGVQDIRPEVRGAAGYLRSLSQQSLHQTWGDDRLSGSSSSLPAAMYEYDRRSMRGFGQRRRGGPDQGASPRRASSSGRDAQVFEKDEKLIRLQREIEKRRQHLFEIMNYKYQYGNAPSSVTSQLNANTYPYQQPAVVQSTNTGYSEPMRMDGGVIKPIDYQINPEDYYVRTSQPSSPGRMYDNNQAVGSSYGPSYSAFDYFVHRSDRSSGAQSVPVQMAPHYTMDTGALGGGWIIENGNIVPPFHDTRYEEYANANTSPYHQQYYHSPEMYRQQFIRQQQEHELQLQRQQQFYLQQQQQQQQQLYLQQMQQYPAQYQQLQMHQLAAPQPRAADMIRCSESEESFIQGPTALYGSGSRDSGVSSSSMVGTDMFIYKDRDTTSPPSYEEVQDGLFRPVVPSRFQQGDYSTPSRDNVFLRAGGGARAAGLDCYAAGSALVPGYGLEEGRRRTSSRSSCESGGGGMNVDQRAGHPVKYVPMETPSMPILDDVKNKSRNRLRDIGSRPLSDDFQKYFRADDPLNVVYRYTDDSDYSVADSAEENSLPEGGVTLQQQQQQQQQQQRLNNADKKSAASVTMSPYSSSKYNFPTKRILLTADPKDRNFRKNGFGLKIVGGQALPWAKNQLGAYVVQIYPGSVADRLHGELLEGDEILEWNGESLTGKTYDEVQVILSRSNCEVELIARPGVNLRQLRSATMSTMANSDSMMSSYDNMDFHVSSSDDALDGVERELKAMDRLAAISSDKSLSSSVKPPEDRVSPFPSMDDESTPRQRPLDRTSVGNESLQTMDGYIGEIQLQLSFDDYDGTLNVHVIQARNLQPRHKSSYANPFVKVYLLPYKSGEDHKRKTKCVPRTLNPEWHRTLVFLHIPPPDLPSLSLEVSVWDQDRFLPNQFMGDVLLDLSDSGCLDNRPHWYSLQEDNAGGPGGRGGRTMSSSDSGGSSLRGGRQDPEGGSSGAGGSRRAGGGYSGGSMGSGGRGGSYQEGKQGGARTPVSPARKTDTLEIVSMEQTDEGGDFLRPDSRVNDENEAKQRKKSEEWRREGGDMIHESVSQELLRHGIGLLKESNKQMPGVSNNNYKGSVSGSMGYDPRIERGDKRKITVSRFKDHESKFMVAPLLGGSFNSALSALFCCFRPSQANDREPIYINSGTRGEESSRVFLDSIGRSTVKGLLIGDGGTLNGWQV